MTGDEMKSLALYVLDYVISNLLLPGQVENWVVFADLDGAGLMSLPYGVDLVVTMRS